MNQKNDENRLNFDCLAYKEKVQTKIYEETKDMSREELKNYFRQRAEGGALADFWRRISERNPKARRAA